VKHSQTFRTSSAAAVLLLAAGLGAGTAQAAAPGITATGNHFYLQAAPALSSQPDGNQVYSWGFGCDAAAPAAPGFVPATVAGGYCSDMQIPGPTLVVTEGQSVTITLKNLLPKAAGNTSIVVPGFAVTTADGVTGLLTHEAANGGGTVSYTFTPDRPGTFAYYSGTQPDLQVEMGLYGAIIVLPATVQGNCPAPATDAKYRLATSAYDHPDTCYDREYLFQLAEMDSNIHLAAQAAVDSCDAAVALNAAATCPAIEAKTEPYRPNYFLVNGRSMPDDMDANYSAGFPHQPYNGNPHMHPGENVLVRVVGQGRWQHPLHIHGNHARVLGYDGHLITAKADVDAIPAKALAAQRLAGPLLFTFPTVSGQSIDAIFTWTGKDLGWDVYGDGFTHSCNGVTVAAAKANPGAAALQAYDPVTKEWCGDHGKPIPVTPPDPQIVANGLWYGGTPYLGLQNGTNGFTSTPLPPGTTTQNKTGGYAFMWHSHDEREITTNDVFPGGLMMMLIIDPPTTFATAASDNIIDETK